MHGMVLIIIWSKSKTYLRFYCENFGKYYWSWEYVAASLSADSDTLVPFLFDYIHSS
jgi:hypothetical protein